MSLPLSETMLKALHALEHATDKHGTPGPKRSFVAGMYASMGTQIDRTLAALERRGYAERVHVSGELCWQPTPSGRDLLAGLAQAAERFRRQHDEAVARPGRRSRLSPLAARSLVTAS